MIKLFYVTNYPDELYHHGIKGMKWGVRRFQYADGSLTPVGIKRYQNGGYSSKSQPPAGSSRISKASYKAKRISRIMSMSVSEATKTVKTKVTGKQYVDTYLAKGTTFSRIQTSKDFENFAFYATYKKADSDKYMGLFGKNLTSRANAAAKAAEKKAKKTGDEADIAEAKQLRETSDNMKVYQLKIKSTKRLKVPSDENAGHITANLLKDKKFKDNVEASIQDSKEKMKRPTQQILFKQAQNALKKEPSKLTSSEKVAIYKALNLSLTNHNAQEVAAQDRFYSELKKKGYNALLDYNDKEFSSYHAKRPMIVFDTDAVKLDSVAETNPKIVNKMYSRYNRDRILKEIPANTLGYLSKFSSKTVSECDSYMKRKMNDYLQ